MSVKKLFFYLDQSEITLRSDHLPLKRFLQKNTLNSKVNNWAMELKSFNIKFEYIQGCKNALADTLSRLIDIDEDTWLPREKQGYGFGYAVFEDLPKIKTFQVNEVTCAAVKRVFYWKNIKENVQQHCKLCPVCMLHRSENVKFERKLFHPSMSPMDFICMDLIGEFHPPTRCGNCFVLTACCMLTGFSWCIPLKKKTADEVVTAYQNHIACPFGGSVKILIDNGTEFKNKLFI